ncbi:MAG TPA: pseudouridine synthase [Tepidisphaeraceae bacterium]|nr:pseudouridine synthase [Tepidisphaeraceae bacterium]
MKERIQKVLANAGVASRRNIEQMVLDGRIAVNGKIMRDLPILIDPQRDKITVDDESIRLAHKRPARGQPPTPRAGSPTNPASRRVQRTGQSGEPAAPLAGRLYFILNKPRGVYSTNVAQGTQLRAIDLLPPDLPGRVYPVGRLDSEAKGLLLLTNDGDLTNHLTHPRYGVPKTYRATVDGSVPPAAIAELERGVWLADPHTGKGFKTGRCEIKVVKRLRERSVLDITIREGRNREIRRIMAKLGHKVRDVVRIKLGPLTLDGLKPGQFRQLTGRELKALREFSGKPRKRPSADSAEINQRRERD